MLSLVIPVYKNQENIEDLLKVLRKISSDCINKFSSSPEYIFVVDGSPDDSLNLLVNALPNENFSSQVISHSRNFGSYAAIRTGLDVSNGKFLAVMAADCQEPPELIINFFESLITGSCDVVVGTRKSRVDPFFSKMFANFFWTILRISINKEIPRGGVDIFGCNSIFKDKLLSLQEANSSLIGQLFWVGFRRLTIPYERQARARGESAWTLAKKLKYMLDSIFSFSALPITLLLIVGLLGVLLSIFLISLVLVFWYLGKIQVPGYTPIILCISFFGGLNVLGLGIVGSYVWRAYENTKARPMSIVSNKFKFL